MGPAGCGKSTVAAQYAFSAAQRGETAVMFCFDESPETLLFRCKAMGMNLYPFVENRSILIQQIDPAELSPGEFVCRVREHVERKNAPVVIIDSLNGFLNAMPDEQYLTLQLHELLSYLGQQGAVAILTMAQHGFMGNSMESPVDVSYLADSVVLFRYFEFEGHIKQAISVVKKRTGLHERTIRELEFNRDGMRVGPALNEFQGILTGVPRFTGTALDLEREP
ncbi:MAG TPA: ATPase domain-containing protein, partial [Acidobacteriaceae bacterium]|nr:ATPase domain-containing protein [Acidobacteriaceae bacterium]